MSHELSKIDRILIDAQRKLRDSIMPEIIAGLDAFERKRIHRFFDHMPEYETKTYRDGEDYVLKIFPVANIKKFAEEKAQQVMQTGNSIELPPMSNYERFIIHEHLKTIEGVETLSHGEGDDRRIEIKPKMFGRRLKRIIKKIKLF